MALDKNDLKILSKLIQEIVRKELSLLKKEILVEMKKAGSTKSARELIGEGVDSDFPFPVKVNGKKVKTKRQLTGNPLIDEAISSVDTSRVKGEFESPYKLYDVDSLMSDDDYAGQPLSPSIPEKKLPEFPGLGAINEEFSSGNTDVLSQVNYSKFLKAVNKKASQRKG